MKNLGSYLENLVGILERQFISLNVIMFVLYMWNQIAINEYLASQVAVCPSIGTRPTVSKFRATKYARQRLRTT